MTKSYKIQFNKRYLKDLQKIPSSAQRQIKESISQLATNPRPVGCKKLQTNKNEAFYRIRCGDYRVVYTIQDHKLLVLIIKIGHHSEVYR